MYDITLSNGDVIQIKDRAYWKTNFPNDEMTSTKWSCFSLKILHENGQTVWRYIDIYKIVNYITGGAPSKIKDKIFTASVRDSIQYVKYNNELIMENDQKTKDFSGTPKKLTTAGVDLVLLTYKDIADSKSIIKGGSGTRASTSTHKGVSSSKSDSNDSTAIYPSCYDFSESNLTEIDADKLEKLLIGLNEFVIAKDGVFKVVEAGNKYVFVKESIEPSILLDELSCLLETENDIEV